ncbi:MAG: glycosyltransferase family 1 protein, partial [Chloroflexi bacterium]|nr:glycosyltransferase family 1 protein [Chloroflexota bacterium]
MVRPFHKFTVVPSLPPKLAPLHELAYNLWWSWNLEAAELFRRLDDALWESSGHNPVLILGRISQDRLMAAANDDGFMAQLARVYQSFTNYVNTRDTWYVKSGGTPNMSVAYFSAEFGITECLPIYSGGMGILSGDHLKSASDLGIPLVGVGLLYQEGYFRQYLNADGWQQESYPINDFYSLPLQRVMDAEGQPLRIQVEYPGRLVTAQIWRAQVGRVPLYLLDTNLAENRPEDRDITDQLYGGDLDMRIRQEIMLGIGGIRALTALGIRPTVCHMNEGHSAFLGLERIRAAMQERKLSFAEARQLTMAGNVFTTHTPVPAGIDLFPQHLMDYYFAEYAQQLGLDRESFLNLGRRSNTPNDEPFSMAILALRVAGHTNGVSKLHAEVARSMWHDLWPQTPLSEVPITPITNGIHSRSWISDDLSSLYTRYLGPGWIERPVDPAVWKRVDLIPDEELWRTHERRRERLVSVARTRARRQLERRGAPPQDIKVASEILNPDILTIGFARRFATYKRATLLFSNVERLAAILNNPERPVQLIFAGKAHPRDNPGKEFIRRLVHYARQDELRRRILFLEDYDMSLARYMVQGVDVWLNTPRHGKEASGTSGMKAAQNGALNLSTLDGWWVEGYAPETGWSIGRGETYEDENYGDQVEANALYDLLEKEIVPLFYDYGGNGIPRGWIAKMKGSIREIAPVFNTHRMVQQYVRDCY